MDRFIEEVCRKPGPSLKNSILASSYTFQRVSRIKNEFDGGVFDGIDNPESDYDEMFSDRHALVHSLVRHPKANEHVLRRVAMVENLFEKLWGHTPGVFDHYKGVALVDIDTKVALKHLEAAIEQPGSNKWTFYHLGRVHREMGNIEGAMSALLEACRRIGGLRRDMEGRTAHTDAAAAGSFRQHMAILAISIGKELVSLGKEESASACFEQAVSIGGESDPDLCVGAAWYQYGISRFEAAVRCLDSALTHKDLGPGKRAAICADKGLMLRMLGRDDDAKTCFESVLKLDPNHEGARRGLSELSG